MGLRGPQCPLVIPPTTCAESPRHPHVDLLDMPQTIHRKENRRDVLLKRLQKSELSTAESEPTNLAGVRRIKSTNPLKCRAPVYNRKPNKHFKAPRCPWFYLFSAIFWNG